MGFQVAGLAVAALLLAGPAGGGRQPERAAKGIAPVPAEATEGSLIFEYGFESGNTLGWDVRVPPLPAPDVFRLRDLDLRDPHVLVDVPGFGCLDFTDVPLPGGLFPSFNDTLRAAIDGDDDGDGLLDLSVLLGYRPFDPGAAGERLDSGLGACSTPVDATVCDWDIPPVPRTSAYDGRAVGLCLEPIAGTTSGYSPAPNEPAGPCVVSEPMGLPLDLFGLEIDLEDSRSAAEIVGGEPTLETGLLLGFLPEAAADAVIIPPEVPLIGGEALSILLPGGAGNCAPGDDRDMHGGQPGWWFYLDFRAEPEAFVGQ